jgi:hypothetical protein
MKVKTAIASAVVVAVAGVTAGGFVLAGREDHHAPSAVTYKAFVAETEPDLTELVAGVGRENLSDVAALVDTLTASNVDAVAAVFSRLPGLSVRAAGELLRAVEVERLPEVGSILVDLPVAPALDEMLSTFDGPELGDVAAMLSGLSARDLRTARDLVVNGAALDDPERVPGLPEKAAALVTPVLDGLSPAHLAVLGEVLETLPASLSRRVGTVIATFPAGSLVVLDQTLDEVPWVHLPLVGRMFVAMAGKGLPELRTVLATVPPQGFAPIGHVLETVSAERLRAVAEQLRTLT